jgi:hydrophobic/amphiphilic exporter-1 (mainly G- bacteria), HAE1 family
VSDELEIDNNLAGGMLFRTIFGVIIIPGLYYIFAHLADGRKMKK